MANIPTSDKEDTTQATQTTPNNDQKTLSVDINAGPENTVQPATKSDISLYNPQLGGKDLSNTTGQDLKKENPGILYAVLKGEGAGPKKNNSFAGSGDDISQALIDMFTARDTSAIKQQAVDMGLAQPEPDKFQLAREMLNDKIPTNENGKLLPQVIGDVAKKTGVDPGFLSSIISAESGGNPNAGAGTSSAKGLGQFTQSTRDAMLQKYGVDAYGDTQNQVMATAILARDNHDAMTRFLGHEASPGETYMAHFLGAGGAAKFFSGYKENPDAPAAAYVDPKAVEANKSIFYAKDGTPRTASQVFKMMSKKVGDSSTAAYASGIRVPTTEGHFTNPLGGQPGEVPGMIEAGNIDLSKRPQVPTDDGGIATVRSIGVNVDGQEVLIPTVSPDGKILSDDDAVKQYQDTGQHLGKFDSPDASDNYAEALHLEQATRYGLNGKPATVPGFPDKQHQDFQGSSLQSAPAKGQDQGTWIGGLSGYLEKDPEDGPISNVLKTIPRLGAAAFRGYAAGTRNFYDSMDNLSTYLSNATGLEKGGLFKMLSKASDYWVKKSDELHNLDPKQFIQNGRVMDYQKFMTGVIGDILGGAVPGFTSFALDSGGMASVKGFAKNGITGALTEQGKTYAMGQIMKAASYLPIVQRALANAGAFGADLYSQVGTNASFPDVMQSFASGLGAAIMTGRQYSPEVKHLSQMDKARTASFLGDLKNEPAIRDAVDKGVINNDMADQLRYFGYTFPDRDQSTVLKIFDFIKEASVHEKEEHGLDTTKPATVTGLSSMHFNPDSIDAVLSLYQGATVGTVAHENAHLFFDSFPQSTMKPLYDWYERETKGESSPPQAEEFFANKFSEWYLNNRIWEQTPDSNDGFNGVFAKIGNKINNVIAKALKTPGSLPPADVLERFMQASTGTIGDGFTVVAETGKNPAYEELAKWYNQAQVVFHGSGQEFGQFDTGKINTGEGAQAYGWGLYFASNKKIAQWYKDSISQKANWKSPVKINGEAVPKDANPVLSNAASYVKAFNGDVKGAIDELNRTAKGLEDGTSSVYKMLSPERRVDSAKELRAAAKLLSDPKTTVEVEMNKGTMSEAEIPEHESFLDLDKKFVNQPPGVRSIIENKFSKYIEDATEIFDRTQFKMGKTKGFNTKEEVEKELRADLGYKYFNEDGSPINTILIKRGSDGSWNAYDTSRLTGRKIYNAISDGLGGDRAASKALDEAGIPGNTYLDAGSRKNQEGTYNYVIFNDKNIKLVKQYAKVERGNEGQDAQEQYRQAIENGDRRQAIELLRQAYGISFKDSTINRNGAHEPASPESGSPAYDVTLNASYPNDFYGQNGIKYYGTGNDAMDQKAYDVIKSVEGRPNKMLTVYRAVEKDHQGGIQPGDWVTTVRDYAKEHGEANISGGYKIEKKIVSAQDIFTEGDSMLEWGYHPQENRTWGNLKRNPELPSFEKNRGEVVPASTSPGIVEGTKADKQWERYQDWKKVGTPDRPFEIVDKMSNAATAILYDAARDTNDPVFGKEGIAQKKGVHVNFDYIKSPDDVKNLVNAVAETIKPEINDARRNVQSHKTTLAKANELLASDMGMTVKTLLNRQRGEAFNAEQATAARMIFLSSAENLMKAAKNIVEVGENSTDALLAFREKVEMHAAIQAQFTGMRAEAGRTLNAFRIALGVDRQTDNILSKVDINEKVLDELGGRDSIEKLAKNIVMMDKGCEGASAAQVTKAVNDFRQPNWKDFVLKYRAASMLSSPKTHARNILGNLTALTMSIPERELAHALGVFYSPWRNPANPENVAPGESFALMNGMLGSIWEGLKLGWQAAKTGKSEYGSRREDVPSADLGTSPQQEKSTLRTISDVLWNVMDGPFRFLGAEDDFFRTLAYRGQLAALAHRQAFNEGLSGTDFKDRVAELKDNPGEEMNRLALNYAEEITFNKPLEGGLRSIQRGVNKYFIGRFIFPFQRTPYNMMKYAMSHTSPLAFCFSDVRNSLINGSGAEQHLAQARMLLGSSLLAVGGMMAYNGLITGKGPSNPAERNIWSQIYQPYSIRIGNNWYSYDNTFEPASSLLALSADFYEAATDWKASKTHDESIWGHLACATVASVFNNITSKSLLMSMTDIVNAMSDPEHYGQKFIDNAARSFIPTGYQQVRQAFDPKVKTVLGFLDTMRNAGIGPRANMPPRRDIFGDVTIMQAAGPEWFGDANLVFSPFRKKAYPNDDGVKEMLRLGMTVDMPSRTQVFGRVPVELSNEQYSRFLDIMGHETSLGNLRDRINNIVMSAPYQHMAEKDSSPEGGAATMLKNVFTFARKQAKAALLKEDFDLQNTVNQQTFEKFNAMRGND